MSDIRRIQEIEPDWTMEYPFSRVDPSRMPPPPPEPVVPDPVGPPKFVRWSSPEGTTCPTCLASAAEGTVPYGHTFSSGVTAPPAHPNCRCSLEPIYEE